MKKGQIITTSNITAKRPGNGIKPTDFYKYIGKKINKSLKTNHLLRDKDLT